MLLLSQTVDITNLISTIGFPIVMCLLLFKYMTDCNKNISELTDKFTEALNHNTLILQKLCDSIDSEVTVDGD